MFSHFSPDKSKSSSGSGITKLSGGSGSGGTNLDTNHDEDNDDDYDEDGNDNDKNHLPGFLPMLFQGAPTSQIGVISSPLPRPTLPGMMSEVYQTIPSPSH